MTKKKSFDKKNLSITNERVFSAVKILISILIALIITFIVLCFISEQPLNAIMTIMFGPLKKARYMGIVIEKTIPYAFAGLAACLLFKAGFFNLGCEGIFIISGVSVAAVAINEKLAIAGLQAILCILAAGITGGILMLIPAFLKAKFNTNEMVLSLMLNSLYAGIAAYLVRTFMLTTTTSTVGSKNYMATAQIGYIFEKFHISACFFLLIAVMIVLEIVMNKTKLGYQIRLSGTNKKFAEYSGINSFKLSMVVNFLAGVLAGVGSACHLLTQTSFYIPSVSVVGIGFSGLLMSMLGKNDPIATVIATFFYQYLQEGASVLYYTDKSVPSEIIAVVVGIVVLLISSQHFLRKYREKKLLKEGLAEHD